MDRSFSIAHICWSTPAMNIPCLLILLTIAHFFFLLDYMKAPARDTDTKLLLTAQRTAGWHNLNIIVDFLATKWQHNIPASLVLVLYHYGTHHYSIAFTSFLFTPAPPNIYCTIWYAPIICITTHLNTLLVAPWQTEKKSRPIVQFPPEINIIGDVKYYNRLSCIPLPFFATHRWNFPFLLKHHSPPQIQCATFQYASWPGLTAISSKSHLCNNKVSSQQRALSTCHFHLQSPSTSLHHRNQTIPVHMGYTPY